MTEGGVNEKRLLVLSLFPLLLSIKKDMTCQCRIPAMPLLISRVRVDRSSFYVIINYRKEQVRVYFSHIVLIFK